MKTRKLLTLLLVACMQLSSLSVSAAFTENFASGEYDSSKWSLYPVDGAVTTEVQKGQTALTIRTGDTTPAAATAATLYVDYGANGYPMYFDYDFSFTSNSHFQIRGGSDTNSIYQFMHAYRVYNNTLGHWDFSKNSFETICDIKPDVVHNLRLECYTEHASGHSGKVIAYLDGVKVDEYQRAENPKAIAFMVPDKNSEVKIYRVARLSNHPNKSYRNYCERFDGETMETLKQRHVTASEDGWTFPENGHEVSLTVDNAETPYLKMNRIWEGGNARMEYSVPDDQTAPGDLNIEFSYFGAGQNMMRFTDATGDQWLCKMFLQDGQLFWGDSPSDYTGTVIKDWVTPYTEHILTLSLKGGAVAIFLDGEFLHLATPFSSGFGSGFPKKLLFYNTEQLITPGNEIANKYMFGGLSIKSISTDDDLAIDSLGQTSIKISITDADGYDLSLLYPDRRQTTIYGNAKIVNLDNEPITGRLIMAKYIDDKLEKILFGNRFTVSAKSVGSSETLSIASDEVEAGAKYKLFAVRDMDGVEPLCASRTLAQPTEMSNEMKGQSYKSEEMWNLSRIAKTIQKANNGENIVVAALGGSITEGAGTSIKANSYANRVADWWEKKYPGQVTRINAGVGGTDSYLGVHRMPGQVLAKNPDFTVVDFAVNDNAHEYQDYAYETIIRDLLSSSDTSSVMMAFFMNNSSVTSLTNAQHLEIPIGEHYGVPMISVRDAVQAQKEAGKLSYSDVMADIVHPNDYGHWLASECITSVLDTVYKNLGDYIGEEYTVPATTVFTPVKYTDATIYVGNNSEGSKFGTELIPTANDGWSEGFAIDYCPSWTNNYGTGWSATEYGQSMSFKVSGKYISLLYRIFKEDKSGIIKVVVDGDEENAMYIDSCESSYVQVGHDGGIINKTLPELADGEHTIDIELIYPGEYDESITRTGNFFGLCGIMTSR